ncbi:MAG: hypothetical protein ACOC0J_00220, partial [Myxococcota bacterium]
MDVRAALYRLIPVVLFLCLLAACGSCEEGGEDNGGGEDPVEIEIVVERAVPDKGPETGGTEVRLEGGGFVEGVAETASAASLHTRFASERSPPDRFRWS